MNKILDLKYPPITTLPGTANMLSILWANKENTMPWFVDHFIQIFAFEKNGNNIHGHFGSFIDDTANYKHAMQMACPFLTAYRLDRDSIFLQETAFSEYVKYQINRNYYIQVSLNQYYLKPSYNYMKKNFMHTTFIYGYNEKEKTINVSDFYSFNKYINSTISYDELNEAYFSHCIKNDDPFWMEIVTLLKYTPYNYKFNVDLFTKSINDYINCEDSFSKYKFDYLFDKSKVVYGLAFYDALVNVLKNDPENLDIKAFHLLYNHKQLFEYRIHYLIEKKYILLNNELLEIIDELIIESLKLRNSVIKYRITKDNDLLNYIIKLCSEIKIKDENMNSIILKTY